MTIAAPLVDEPVADLDLESVGPRDELPILTVHYGINTERRDP